MKAVFFGTPEFAVPSLEALLPVADVALVVTRPDRPVGRRSQPVASPVAVAARQAGLEIARPERLRGDDGLRSRLARAAPDVGIIVAYGKILPDEILAVPRLGFVNVHASLLPRHRGASPVQAAILSGDAETGVVTMRVVPELDAGPVYLERRVSIGPDEDAGTLSDRLSRLGSQLLVETLSGLAAGTLSARPQAGLPTYCRPIAREDGEVDWSLSAGQIVRRLRAFTPWPGLFTFLGPERVKILEARERPGSSALPPGTLFREGGEAVAAAGDGTKLALLRLQRAGRKPAAGPEFLRGVPVLPVLLGPAPAAS